MHRWAVALFRQLRRPLPSLRFLRIKATLDPYDLGNNRPISNLTFLSKLLEHAAYEQIVGFLDRFQLLPELQSAYRKYRSTETATIKVMSDVYEAADAGSVTLLGLLDLSAAFDTVDHRILLDRLKHDYGVRGLVIQWIESYLTGRSQFVRFNGVTSKTAPVTSGVPQGSVLGPILFISYSAEVVATVQHQGFKVHAFADDLQIYGSTAQNGVADLMARMSICIECVASWMSSNRLRLNPSKTKLIWQGTSRRLLHCEGLGMTVCGADVRPVECVRDLGVLIDSNMTLESRQQRSWHLFLSAAPATHHPTFPDDRCCTLAGSGFDPHSSRLYTVYRCLHGLAPHYLSDLCTPATVHAQLRSSVTWTIAVYSPDENQDVMSPWILLCFVRSLECTPSASARPWSFVEQF